MFTFFQNTLPLGGKIFDQLIDKGPVVLVLTAILIIGYRRYNRIADEYMEESRKFMNTMDNKLSDLQVKANKILNKLGASE